MVMLGPRLPGTLGPSADCFTIVGVVGHPVDVNKGDSTAPGRCGKFWLAGASVEPGVKGLPHRGARRKLEKPADADQMPGLRFG